MNNTLSGALRKIRNVASQPGTVAQHGNAFAEGMRRAANMIEAKFAAQPEPVSDAAQGEGEWVLTMRSGVSPLNDSVIGTFRCYTTALAVGGFLYAEDKLCAPEYRTFDIAPAAQPAPVASDAREGGWRTDWPEMKCRRPEYPNIFDSDRVLVSLDNGRVDYDRAERFADQPPQWFINRGKVLAWQPYPAALLPPTTQRDTTGET